MPSKLRLLLPIGLLAFGAFACSGSSAGSRDSHMLKGDDYLSKKDIRSAVLEYGAAIQADPKFGPAHEKLADTYVLAGDNRGGVKEMVTAADLMPESLMTQIKATRLLIVAGRYEDARGRAEKAVALDPRNVEAQILMGNSMAGLKDLGGAITQVENALRADPNSAVAYANLGALQQARGDIALAEAAFKRAVFTDPKSVPARLALANMYWSTNRKREAEESLVEAIKLEPNDPLTNRALAFLYLGSNRAAMAEAPLKVVAENSPTPAGRLSLGDYYSTVHRLAEAKAIYVEVAKSPEFGSLAKLRLASLGLLDGDRAGAYKLIDEVLAKDPHNVQALVGKAQLQFGDKLTTEALATVRVATDADHDSSLAHELAGRILASQNQFEDAEAEFKEALRADPQFAPASLDLARLALDRGNAGEALLFAKAAVQVAPASGEGNLLLARAYLASGNAAAAEGPLKLVAAANPDLPDVLAEMGRLLYAKKDLAGSRAVFERALAGDKNRSSVVEGLVALDMAQKGTAAARKRLDDAVAAAPGNSDLQVMAGRVYATVFKDSAAAEKAAQRAIAADGNNLAAFDLLARVHVQANNLSAATTEFEKIADRQPKSVGNQTAIGVLLDLQNKHDEARARYEKALALDPRAPVASNNLAQIFVDKNENLDVALNLAQTAKAGLPKAHEVDDTLGWVYYKKGNALSAITALKAAVAAQPENAIYLYHLGAAYALNKDKVNARQSLDKALKLQPTFPGSDDARKILDSLK